MTAAAPDLLDLIAAVADGPESWRIAERDRVIAAMEDDNATHGDICANRVRRLLTNPATGALDVNPRVYSATFAALAHSGDIVHAGWTSNDDTRGGNAGKPQRLWKWVEA